MKNKYNNGADWKTVAIIVLAIAVVVLFVMQLSGVKPNLSPGQTEWFKSIIVSSGDPTSLTSDGAAGKLESQNNDLILGTKRTASPISTIHPIVFQQNGKEVARIDGKGNVNVKGLNVGGEEIYQGMLSRLNRCQMYSTDSVCFNRNGVISCNGDSLFGQIVLDNMGYTTGTYLCENLRATCALSMIKSGVNREFVELSDCNLRSDASTIRVLCCFP